MFVSVSPAISQKPAGPSFIPLQFIEIILANLAGVVRSIFQKTLHFHGGPFDWEVLDVEFVN